MNVKFVKKVVKATLISSVAIGIGCAAFFASKFVLLSSIDIENIVRDQISNRLKGDTSDLVFTNSERFRICGIQTLCSRLSFTIYDSEVEGELKAKFDIGQDSGKGLGIRLDFSSSHVLFKANRLHSDRVPTVKVPTANGELDKIDSNNSNNPKKQLLISDFITSVAIGLSDAEFHYIGDDTSEVKIRSANLLIRTAGGKTEASLDGFLNINRKNSFLLNGPVSLTYLSKGVDADLSYLSGDFSKTVLVAKFFEKRAGVPLMISFDLDSNPSGVNVKNAVLTTDGLQIIGSGHRDVDGQIHANIESESSEMKTVSIVKMDKYPDGIADVSTQFYDKNLDLNEPKHALLKTEFFLGRSDPLRFRIIGDYRLADRPKLISWLNSPVPFGTFEFESNAKSYASTLNDAEMARAGEAASNGIDHDYQNAHFDFALKNVELSDHLLGDITGLISFQSLTLGPTSRPVILEYWMDCTIDKPCIRIPDVIRENSGQSLEKTMTGISGVLGR